MSWIEQARLQADRFWAKVSKGDPDACWPWLAGTDKDGYGKFSITLPAVNGKNPQKHVRAHRLALILSTGKELSGQALHSCDNPPCCNPDHLRDGTASDNATDSILRDRKPRGEFHDRAKLTKEQVVYVRRARGKETARFLALKFGVSSAAIGHVWSGRNWKG